MQLRVLEDVPGRFRRVLRRVDFVGKMKIKAEGGDLYRTYDEPEVADLADANVVTSVIDAPGASAEDNVLHAPVLDLDFPCELIPSTTPGHFHLVMDIEIPWVKYAAVLNAMAAAGILQDGYVAASLDRGYSSIRLPWVKKEDSENKEDVA